MNGKCRFGLVLVCVALFFGALTMGGDAQAGWGCGYYGGWGYGGYGGYGYGGYGGYYGYPGYSYYWPSYGYYSPSYYYGPGYVTSYTYGSPATSQYQSAYRGPVPVSPAPANGASQGTVTPGSAGVVSSHASVPQPRPTVPAPLPQSVNPGNAAPAATPAHATPAPPTPAGQTPARQASAAGPRSF